MDGCWVCAGLYGDSGVAQHLAHHKRVGLHAPAMAVGGFVVGMQVDGYWVCAGLYSHSGVAQNLAHHKGVGLQQLLGGLWSVCRWMAVEFVQVCMATVELHRTLRTTKG